MSDTGCVWWWRKPDTGKPSSFDEEAARRRACEDEPNPKGSPFYSGPESRFEP